MSVSEKSMTHKESFCVLQPSAEAPLRSFYEICEDPQFYFGAVFEFLRNFFLEYGRSLFQMITQKHICRTTKNIHNFNKCF